jgi:hypothetical protein
VQEGAFSFFGVVFLASRCVCVNAILCPSHPLQPPASWPVRQRATSQRASQPSSQPATSQRASQPGSQPGQGEAKERLEKPNEVEVRVASWAPPSPQKILKKLASKGCDAHTSPRPARMQAWIGLPVLIYNIIIEETGFDPCPPKW